ncbi:MAG: hypothetical protein U5J83_11775 [Bryobacterales bacterium]|nr:hypothetical protein [Bryobacterales bacterium]
MERVFALFPEELNGRKALRDERQRGTGGEWNGVAVPALDAPRPERAEDQEKNKEK